VVDNLLIWGLNLLKQLNFVSDLGDFILASLFGLGKTDLNVFRFYKRNVCHFYLISL